jgi:hypothetical protein
MAFCGLVKRGQAVDDIFIEQLLILNDDKDDLQGFQITFLVMDIEDDNDKSHNDSSFLNSSFPRILRTVGLATIVSKQHNKTHLSSQASTDTCAFPSRFDFHLLLSNIMRAISSFGIWISDRWHSAELPWPFHVPL